ncbi:preprotein translocase subunit SecY [Candidatus Woesearchaeota archaeon]|nr:preprotein translocase subunit SecY [Candidatus Woesearchaeota archaeon]
MTLLDRIIDVLPEIAKPTQRRLSFKEKLKWTGIILFIFYVMGHMPLFGLGQNSLEQFEYLSIILGASFGSITSLGIGPIVTASIVLQLLNGSGILKFDLTQPEGKRQFQGLQKIMAIFFIVFEAIIYVMMGGLAPAQELVNTALYGQLQFLLIFQLILGGIIVLFMDEVISKWGFGSGISLFIAAGVSQEIFIRAINPLKQNPTDEFSIGAIPRVFQALSSGAPTEAGLAIGLLISTVLVFMVAVFAQAMKIEIPLSFGRVRGQGMRWPLNFIYTSNIPVILVAALLANVQLWGRLLQGWFPDGTFLGRFAPNGTPTGGLAYFVNPPNLLANFIEGSISSSDLGIAAVYLVIMIIGCVIFSIFWVQTAGMDARSQAKQIMASGLQIPGFRKDQRVLESVLTRYIMPLTVMGAITVGLLAGFADLTGALGSGTGLLLTVMIIYRLYEEIAKQHMMDMNPMMRKFME